MSRIPTISDAEWQVMEVLWAESPIAATAVAARLLKRHQWHTRTVKTMLSRLVKKGALDFTVVGNRYLYSPKITREQSIGHASRSFLERIFSGDSSQALMHLVEHTELTEQQIQHLKRLLDEKQMDEKQP